MAADMDLVTMDVEAVLRCTQDAAEVNFFIKNLGCGGGGGCAGSGCGASSCGGGGGCGKFFPTNFY